MQREVQRTEREANPAIAKKDAAVARTLEQVVTQQRFQIGQDARVAGGVQAMAAVVHANASDVEASGVAAGRIALLENHHAAELSARGLERCADTRGPRAQDRERHACRAPSK